MRIQTRLFLGTAMLVLALTAVQWWLHQRQLAAVESELSAVATAVRTFRSTMQQGALVSGLVLALGLVVARAGDLLTVTSEGGPAGAPGVPGEALETMVWVDDGGEPGVRKKVVVVRDGDGENRYTVELDVEVERIVRDGAHAVFIARDPAGRAPMIHGAGARPGMVRYHCEATGSELLIPEADALQESYICPATSCVMTRVEEPEAEVITIRKKRVETGDE